MVIKPCLDYRAEFLHPPSAQCVSCEVLLGFSDSHAKCVALLALAASHSQTGWIAFAGFFTLGADWTRLRKNYRDQARPHHLRKRPPGSRRPFANSHWQRP